MKIQVHTPFNLTLDAGESVHYAIGVHEVSKEVGGHWFTQAHCTVLSVDDDANDSTDDELLILQLREELEIKDKAIEDLQSQRLEQKQLVDDLQGQLASKDQDIANLVAQVNQLTEQINKTDLKQEKGKDGKKPDPANSGTVQK